MTHGELAQALLQAIRAQHFEATPDAMRGGAPIAHFPSLDLAVIAFPPDASPIWANVLLSREHPQGLVADIAADADAGAVRNLRYLADRTDVAGISDAWLPDADWSTLHFDALAGDGARRFVTPYPASLIKLMVAVGVARQVDAGTCEWITPVARAGRTRSVAAWTQDMLTISCNDSTSALVALLHAQRAIVREADGKGGRETRNALHEAFAAQGLATLRLANTKADGGWRNADAAGVGHLQMTAWDSARLLWLLDAEAPRAPWLPIDAPKLLGDESRARIRAWLAAQMLHDALSSALPADIRFAHKTGSTENYAADAGIVRGIAPSRRHYIVALTSNLGTRYAQGRLPALGAAIDATMAAWLERGS